MKIDIPQLLLHLRSEITSGTQANGHRKERFAFKLWAVVMTRPWLYRFSAATGRVFQRFFKPPVKAWTNGRDLRPLERESFREHWRRTH